MDGACLNLSQLVGLWRAWVDTFEVDAFWRHCRQRHAEHTVCGDAALRRYGASPTMTYVERDSGVCCSKVKQ